MEGGIQIFEIDRKKDSEIEIEIEREREREKEKKIGLKMVQ